MIIGIIQISTAWLLACYPRRLPKESTTAKGFMTIAAQKSTQQRNKPKERTFKGIFFAFFFFFFNIRTVLIDYYPNFRVSGSIASIVDQQDSDSQ